MARATTAAGLVQVSLPPQAAGYTIHIEAGVLSSLGALLKTACPKAQQVLIVSEIAVATPCLATAQESLEAAGYQVHSYNVAGGEACKSLVSAQALYDVCLAHQLTRHDVVLALGGGIIGDLAGYVAATYRRGMGFVQCPTTLLAQVDASVGGKVAVNYGAYKNMVGVFYQPQLVLVDPKTLATLPPRDVACGMAEVIKYALLQHSIPNGESLPSLLETLQALPSLRLADLDPAALQSLIQTCCQLKAWVVEADPEEKLGIREFLNLGHTFAHAYEHCSNGDIPHGEAVAMGLHHATRLAVQQGIVPASALQVVIALCEKAGLPTRPPVAFSAEALCEAMLQDKKRQQGESIRFILPVQALGRVEARELPVAEVRALLT